MTDLDALRKVLMRVQVGYWNAPISKLAAGLIVRTWSPGDGVTRYRFFSKPEADGQSYFGPANGVYTALGLKEAWAFVAGAKVSA